jgi:hypothetical protein
MANVLNRTTLELRLKVSEKEYPVSEWIINPDLSAVQGVPVDYWLITGDQVKEMDASERAAVDAEMLPIEKAAKTQKFIQVTADFGESRYSLDRQQILSVLRSEARFDGLVNRANYIGKLLDWMNQVLNYYDMKNAELQALTTRDEVAAFAWDFTNLVNSDPLVTIYDARQIPD